MFVYFYEWYEAMEQNKEYLKTIKFTDINGKNVIDFITRVLALDERLDSVGEFEPNMLCNIVNITETFFLHYVCKLRVSDPYTIDGNYPFSITTKYL